MKLLYKSLSLSVWPRPYSARWYPSPTLFHPPPPLQALTHLPLTHPPPIQLSVKTLKDPGLLQNLGGGGLQHLNYRVLPKIGLFSRRHFFGLDSKKKCIGFLGKYVNFFPLTHFCPPKDHQATPGSPVFFFYYSKSYL